MRFADEISLAKDEALDVLQILSLAVDALGEAGLVVEAVQSQELGSPGKRAKAERNSATNHP